MTIVESTRLVTGGVDTHLEVHVAAALADPAVVSQIRDNRIHNFT
jgi:hypothetical protein